MSSHHMIEAIAFDAYGTLFDVASVRAACRSELEATGTAERAERVLAAWRAKQLEYTWLVSLMGRFEDFWSVTRRALAYALRAADVSLDEPARERLLEAFLRLEAFGDVAPALARLCASAPGPGLERRPLAVLSNGSRAMLDEVLRRAGLATRFERVLSADQARIFKPSPRVYRLVCDAFVAEPSSILFVSSNTWDVAGAAAFGFRTVRLARQGASASPEEALDLAADVTVESLDALVDWLDDPGSD